MAGVSTPAMAAAGGDHRSSAFGAGRAHAKRAKPAGAHRPSPGRREIPHFDPHRTDNGMKLLTLDLLKVRGPADPARIAALKS